MLRNPINVRQLCARIVAFARTSHGFIVLSGALVGLCYFPAWFGHLFQRALAGGLSWLLIATMLLFVGLEIWQKRSHLQTLTAAAEDRTIGHALILSGLLVYPFCRFALWSQALVWLMVLLGILISTWGVMIFQHYQLSIVFLGLTVYPKLGVLSRTLWDFLFPPYVLENVMAKGATLALSSWGWQVVAEGRFIIFPQGRVEVGWGCNGLDMAIAVALMGLFMGLIFKQPLTQIAKLMVTGGAIALLANIPRLMLVAVAYVYWGQDWFKFWHGFWGGQVFSAILFTAYYYLSLYLMRPSREVS